MKVDKEEPIEIVEEQQQKKEIKFIGSQRQVPGLTLWEFNWGTRQLKPASFKKEDVAITSLKPTKASAVKHSKVITQENCWYFQALNRSSAGKKVRKAFNSVVKKFKETD